MVKKWVPKQIQAERLKLQVISDELTPDVLQRCQDLGLLPTESLGEISGERRDRVFRYMQERQIPFNTMIILNLATIKTISGYFKCQKCGKCCQEIGIIRLAPFEPKRIADYLGVSTKSIKRLTEEEEDGGRVLTTPCPFYQNTCTIQQVKPASCILYPIADPVLYKGHTLMQLSTFCDTSIDLCKWLLADYSRKTGM